MGEMTKTSVKYCRKCKYSYKHNQTEIMCGYYLQTRLRRECPVGMFRLYINSTWFFLMYGIPPSRNPTLTATDGMLIRGCG